MKKTKITAMILSAAVSVSSITSAYAAEIPRESVPKGSTEESILITENLISDILEEVQNGMSYGTAWGKVNPLIFNAVVAKNTNSYGYGDLAAIARNAIFQYRDMYLRPNYYAEKESDVRTLLSDLITDVENGKDYEEARKEAYIRIHQSADPSYVANMDIATDQIYLDIPAVDSAMFSMARKLLLEAQARRDT